MGTYLLEKIAETRSIRRLQLFQVVKVRTNEKQQPWKEALPDFIAHCYVKRFNRSAPAQVRSLKQLIEADEMKRKIKHERKASESAGQPGEIVNTNASSKSHGV